MANPAVRLRGRCRSELAAQLVDCARTSRPPVGVATLAARVGRKPSAVRRLLAEGGFRSRRMLLGFADDEVTAALAARYRLGVTVEQLHADSGIDRRVIRERVRAAGTPTASRRRRGDLALPEAELVAAYDAGVNLAGLAELAGGSYGTVRRVLLDAGVQLRPRGRQEG
jgi:hypothetical protein